MGRHKRYSSEVRKRAVRLGQENQSEHASQWTASVSIATKIDCTPETLRKWVRRHEVDSGQREGVSSDERQRVQALER
jgi:transposase